MTPDRFAGLEDLRAASGPISKQNCWLLLPAHPETGMQKNHFENG